MEAEPQKNLILIIDDNKDDYLILRRFIEPEFKTVYNSGQEEFIEDIEMICPNCILLDYNLGTKDGIDQLKKLKANQSIASIPVIMLTNEKRPDVIIESMKNNASDYLIKDTIRKTNTVQAINRAIHTANLERQIKEQQERLQGIIEATHAGTWEWNVQTGELRINERWAEITGYSIESIQPISRQIWLKSIHPEDITKTEKALEKHFNGEEDFYRCECRIKHKDGEWVWVLDHGKVVSRTKEGNPIWMFGTQQEITERKQQEEAIAAYNIELQEATEVLKDTNTKLA